METFAGRWRIVSMENWSDDFIHRDEPAYFEFDTHGLGAFHFGSIHGRIDARYEDGKLAYSWLGDSEGQMLCGRGEFVITGESTSEGKLFIHCGGFSAIRIEKIC